MEEGYKPCPHCAEPIREAATICRYCNRNVVTPPEAQRPPDGPDSQAVLATPAVPVTPRSEGTRNAVAALLLFALILIFVWVVVQKSKNSSSPDTTESSVGSPATVPPLIPHPVAQKLLNGNLDVQAGSYQYVNFSVPADAIRAKVTGSFHAFGGAGNDIQVVIATPSEFENWINGHQAQVYYSTDKTTNGTIDRQLPPGDYMLAFNNRFSALSRKEVTGEITLSYVVP